MKKLLITLALLLALAALAQLPKPGGGGGGSAAPSGSAGGGLTGTYPNPTVASVPLSAIPESVRTRTVGLSLGATISTGSKGYVHVPFACTVNQWTVLADQTGSIVVDVKRSTYSGFGTTASIVGGSGNKPTLSSVQKNQASPTSWTSTAIAAGDVLEFVVDSTATVQTVHVSLRCVIE